MKRATRASYLSYAERTIRRNEAVDMYRAGHVPAGIGARLNLTADYVRKLLIEAGVWESPGVPEARFVDPMWEMSEDERRVAIWRRQHKGARDTRREREGQAA